MKGLKHLLLFYSANDPGLMTLPMPQLGIILIITFASVLNLTGQTSMASSSTIQEESNTVVFIHDLFQNPESWDEWKKYFEAKGRLKQSHTNI